MIYLIILAIIIVAIIFKSALSDNEGNSNETSTNTQVQDVDQSKEIIEPKPNNDFNKAYYGTDSLVSKAELNFYRILNNICNELDCILFSKVRVADIVKVRSIENRQSYFNRIKSKHIDFVLCDKISLKPILCIELDDKSHNNAKRIARDKFVDEIINIVGFKIIHMRCSYSYNSQSIKEQIKKEIQV
ncbi:DUF2726 domain-containing protein [Vallitalea pronyensis]|uniref:DUF2726 domain-containing protein n=1 Tax=Vallitalea pronyensis TaxID=1348613 RepID=A0A8J8MN55_9FIRM|nr:DUF2726 domain-containing protein [Vallitalea pronyensis]QUI24845.1 DUF2726 domain-containing protein [Vallitalea pronyensis]